MGSEMCIRDSLKVAHPRVARDRPSLAFPVADAAEAEGALLRGEGPLVHGLADVPRAAAPAQPRHHPPRHQEHEHLHHAGPNAEGNAARALHETFFTVACAVQIGDFSVSRMLTKENYLRSSRIGTPLFLSPEIIRKEKYDQRVSPALLACLLVVTLHLQSDVWSLGVVVYSLACLEMPFSGDNIEHLMHAIQFKHPKELPM